MWRKNGKIMLSSKRMYQQCRVIVITPFFSSTTSSSRVVFSFVMCPQPLSRIDRALLSLYYFLSFPTHIFINFFPFREKYCNNLCFNIFGPPVRKSVAISPFSNNYCTHAKGEFWKRLKIIGVRVIVGAVISSVIHLIDPMSSLTSRKSRTRSNHLSFLSISWSSLLKRVWHRSWQDPSCRNNRSAYCWATRAFIVGTSTFIRIWRARRENQGSCCQSRRKPQRKRKKEKQRCRHCCAWAVAFGSSGCKNLSY